MALMRRGQPKWTRFWLSLLQVWQDSCSNRPLYGDATTIHTAQGSTSREHIAAFPAGSQVVRLQAKHGFQVVALGDDRPAPGARIPARAEAISRRRRRSVAPRESST
jgi:hypothetical protein